jgi:RNA ligase (TIGR02306 family)
MNKIKISVGLDVTEILNVTKYDPQGDKERLILEQKQFLFNKKIDNYLKRYSWFRKLVLRPSRDKFPTFISKTDEDRIQLFPNICVEHKGTEFVVTEKLDGSSCTYFVTKNPHKWQFWKPYIFGVCSRRLQLFNKDNNWWKVAIEQSIEKKLKQYAMNSGIHILVIQGELIGEGVQGNKYGIKGHDFYMFNLIIDGKKQGSMYQSLFCNELGLKPCPFISSDYKLKDTIHDCVLDAKGNSLIGKKPIREGIVVRNYEKNISFKIINPDFLLKYDE